MFLLQLQTRTGAKLQSQSQLQSQSPQQPLPQLQPPSQLQSQSMAQPRSPGQTQVYPTHATPKPPHSNPNQIPNSICIQLQAPINLSTKSSSNSHFGAHSQLKIAPQPRATPQPTAKPISCQNQPLSKASVQVKPPLNIVSSPPVSNISPSNGKASPTLQRLSSKSLVISPRAPTQYNNTDSSMLHISSSLSPSSSASPFSTSPQVSSPLKPNLMRENAVHPLQALRPRIASKSESDLVSIILLDSRFSTV